MDAIALRHQIPCTASRLALMFDHTDPEASLKAPRVQKLQYVQPCPADQSRDSGSEWPWTPVRRGCAPCASQNLACRNQQYDHNQAVAAAGASSAIGSNRCRSDFRLKLESSCAHPAPGGGIIPLSGDPFISTRQVDGMIFPLPTRDWRAGLWLDVLVTWLR